MHSHIWRLQFVEVSYVRVHILGQKLSSMMPFNQWFTFVSLCQLLAAEAILFLGLSKR